MVGWEGLHDDAFSCSMAVEDKIRRFGQPFLVGSPKNQESEARTYSLSLAGGFSPASLSSSAWTCRSWSPLRCQA
ncbi:hypothetical protein GOODEAATRI_001778, partial [Goodea atripinnis]